MLAPDDLAVDIWPPQPTTGMRVGMPKGVKVTHIPSGLYATCDRERSQHRCRDIALAELESIVAVARPSHRTPDVSDQGTKANLLEKRIRDALLHADAEGRLGSLARDIGIAGGENTLKEIMCADTMHSMNRGMLSLHLFGSLDLN